MGYKFLEHTADVMVEAYGATIGEAFSFAAKAMFEVMFDTRRVSPNLAETVDVEGTDLKSLLYSWLEELLFRFSVEGIAFSHFKFKVVEKGDKLSGTGEARGEPYNRTRHGARTEVKAVTYAEMDIIDSESGSKIRFVLDI
jgi:SHS2 domain-containing protein